VSAVRSHSLAIALAAWSVTGSTHAHSLPAQASPAPRRPVTYLRDETTDVRGSTVKLLGGSTWRTTGLSLLLPITAVIIVRSDSSDIGLLYADGVDEVVTRVSGSVAWDVGTLTSVVRQFDKGAVLQTADGRLWNVPSYDRYDSGWWLPPYPALITSSELYLFNLKKGKRIWVSPTK